MRHCSYCGEDKPYDPSAPKHTKASGFSRARCWDCRRKASVVDTMNWRAQHPEKYKEANRVFHAQWKQKNSGKCNASNMAYYTAKLQRVMPWTEHAAIKALYIAAKAKGMQVDHIYPIQSAVVSGLHVLANLQLLTPSANASKGNRVTTEI